MLIKIFRLKNCFGFPLYHVLSKTQRDCVLDDRNARTTQTQQCCASVCTMYRMFRRFTQPNQAAKERRSNDKLSLILTECQTQAHSLGKWIWQCTRRVRHFQTTADWGRQRTQPRIAWYACTIRLKVFCCCSSFAHSILCPLEIR